ncbi:GlxA family transcriptional regulator [Rhizobium bangladeshense]|uniref:GlxA family transcriptional regulator n=1 Tax=Rhizobium bangladeshense TaxID=1138189 RepID=A0ABS7LK66_9HYPH|nr:GlxA family transcriptional regulator [Rhizobium bangladeshense]MBX4868772.1 GlxA family transcriptional regulator [Rhizobium bangladeshense]MBX4873773.1 GlxA family transcriptional regulator [Rhizobium bangladeshense]MBX4884773.1 GlxA family transcriptional regulator [Rhizobium bangladeshense]MBX4933738.1 GlxA family transcriptional regulator [Rhizobium bangladeshense]MBY3583552.1 GlxA family transcriptional regulator [Rhizobium bangladeshense]
MQHIAFLLYPGFQIMSLAAVSVFEFTNLELGRKAYDITHISEAGGVLRTSLGMPIETEPFGDPAFDTLIVVGAPDLVLPKPGESAFMRAALGASRRIASICTGAFYLAEAGILDGRRATTHWCLAREMKARYPKIRVEEDRIFIIDGSVWTSAGMTAGIDLALAMVEKDHGIEVARAVARMLVVYHRRAGGQSQFSALLELEPKSDRIQKALDFARKNLKAQLSVEELAEAAHLSPRQFSRAFRSETGQSPAKAVENLRLEAARLMMEQSRHPIDVVADETGFADRERMRRAFLRAFGQPPQAIRRNAQQQYQS